MGMKTCYTMGFPMWGDGKKPKTRGKEYDASINYRIMLQISFKNKSVMFYW